MVGGGVGRNPGWPIPPVISRRLIQSLESFSSSEAVLPAVTTWTSSPVAVVLQVWLRPERIACIQK